LFIQVKTSKFSFSPLFHQYRETCNKLKKEIKSAVNIFESNLAMNSKSTPKLLYSYLNKQVKPKDAVAALKGPEDQLIVDRDSICNALNEYFHSVFEPSTPAELADAFAESFNDRSQDTMEWNENLEISQSIVFSKLSKLDPAKAPGVDGVSNAVLRNCAASRSVPLTLIFHKSISERALPIEWREANITPLFKKSSRTSTSNYRPVSLTSAVCKVLESIIKDSLMTHLEDFNLLSSKQHGFVHGRACVTNLIDSSDYRTLCFED
jgi:hypothetical protein